MPCVGIWHALGHELGTGEGVMVGDGGYAVAGGVMSTRPVPCTCWVGLEEGGTYLAPLVSVTP
jgi:hypothetical protein